ncbi:MAG: hypothetical protein WDO69_35585 [Pseudomonadota bacterium]
MNKRPNGKSKPPTQAAHPETQHHPRAKTGAPGSESSKTRNRAKDVRSAHDQDGNSELRGRWTGLDAPE